MTTHTTTDELKRELDAALAPLSDEDRRLAGTLVGLLAEGRPVASERVADALSRPTPEAAEAIARLPWVYRDEDGRVIGAWGMSVVEMPHRLRIDGRALYTWCAHDALWLPLGLGTRAEVQSRCPSTGQQISLTVGPDDVRDPSPAGMALSFLRIGADSSTRDAISNFCHFIHFFASHEAAQDWTAEHEGTFWLSLDDAFELARFWAARAFGTDPDPLAG